MVVAEIPDTVDDRFGTIFSNKFMEAIKAFFTRHEVEAYFTYAVKCRKPSNSVKINQSKNVKVCSTNYLHREIERVQPKHIICLGGNAMYGACKDKGIGTKQGQKFFSKNANAWIYPTYHALTSMYDADKRAAFWNELAMYIEMIKGFDVSFEPPVKVCSTLSGLRKIQQKIKDAGGFAAADTETEGFNMFVDGKHVRCLQLCWDEKYGGVFIPLGIALEPDLYDGTEELKVTKTRKRKVVDDFTGKTKQVTYEVEKVVLEKKPARTFWKSKEELAEAIKIIQEILRDTWLMWHNGKFDRKWLYMWGLRMFGKPIVCPKIWCDSIHLAHLLNENRASFRLRRLLVDVFRLPSYDVPDKMTKDLSILIPYATKDTVALLMLGKKLLKQLAEVGNEKLKLLYEKVIRPMDRAYTEIELEGWPLSLAVAESKRKMIEPRLAETLGEMDDYLEQQGIVVDRNDPKRYTAADKLAKTIFEDLGLPIASDPKLALTDEGKLSTETSALLHIRKHPWILLLSKYKKMIKALSTYIKPMIHLAKTRGKLSTSYKMHGTDTGRSASGKEDTKAKKGEAMNLQNIPYIFNIKEIIQIEDNPLTGQRRLIGESDLSQVELRIVANESKDPLMLWAYQNDVDLHTYRAIRNMGLDKEHLEQGLNKESWEYITSQGEWAQLSKEVRDDARKKAKPCFAQGSLVLTDHGLIPIEKVRLDQKVWDGVNWVSHEGVICKGVRKVITVQGLTATPNHKVYLRNGGMATMQEVYNEGGRLEIATGGIGETPVRYAHRSKCCYKRGQLSCSRHAMLRLSRHLQNSSRQRAQRQNNQLSLSTQKKGWRQQQTLPQPPNSKTRGALRCDSSALRQSARCELQELRSARNTQQVHKARVHRLLSERVAARDLQRGSNRSQRQQRSLRTGQSTASYTKGKLKQQTQFTKTHLQRSCAISGRLSGCLKNRPPFVCLKGGDRTPLPTQRNISRSSPQKQSTRLLSKEKVYDIINAGPLHRLTVSGKIAAQCNFGYVYGMWWKKFLIYAAKNYDIDFTPKEAEASRTLYFHDHTGLEPWYRRVAEVGRRKGYVESLSGRRRRLPDLQLNWQGDKEKERLYKDALRKAINSPIQSFGSGDLKLMAILGIRTEMKKRGWWGKKMMIIGEVHDSVLYWADEDIIVEVTEICQRIMRHPPLLDELNIHIDVKLDSESKIGPSLGKMLEVDKARKLAQKAGKPVTHIAELIDFQKQAA